MRARARIIGAVILLGMPIGALRGHCQSQTVSFTRQGDAIQVNIGGQPFTTYHFDPKIAKPFFQPLRTANGIAITRGFPIANTVPSGYERDPNLEPHQRDMYFAHGNIDGYDFWSEEVFAKYYDTVHPETFGRMVLRTVEEQSGGSSSATIRATFDLEGPDKRPFAQEVQTFTFSGDKDSRAVDCEFVLHAAGRALTFGDTKEGTFALRLAPQLTAPAGTMVSSEGGVGEPQIWGKRADWVNVDGVIEGHSLGVVIFDSPKSFHHPTYWHARGYGLLAANPFGLSFFLKDPHQNGSYTVPAGQSIRFCYRVFIHNVDYRQARVAEKYKAYAASQAAAR